jgi:hypothetical protein
VSGNSKWFNFPNENIEQRRTRHARELAIDIRKSSLDYAAAVLDGDAKYREQLEADVARLTWERNASYAATWDEAMLVAAEIAHSHSKHAERAISEAPNPYRADVTKAINALMPESPKLNPHPI